MPKGRVPGAQVVYGEIVYWFTILASLVCMVGPAVSMASPERNVLHPSRLFGNIFRGEQPLSVWALSATDEVKLAVRTRVDGVEAEAPQTGPQAAAKLLLGLPAPSGEAGAGPELSVEDLRLTRIGEDEWLREGESKPLTTKAARGALLAVYGRHVFHGGHFWADHLGHGDGFTQFGLALGCSVGLWGLLAAAAAYLRNGVFLYVALALWVAALVFLAAANLVATH